MKKAIFLFLLLTTQYMAAQDKQVVNIIHPAYTALREGEQIERVKTDKKATTLYFCVKGDSGAWERFSSCSYLVDEQGKRHPVVGTKNVKLDEKKYFGKKHQLNFSASFEPLPSGTKRFDLITDGYMNGGGAYYGIREEGTPLLAPDAIDTTGTYRDVAKVFPDSIFRADSVWISGQIENCNTLKKRVVRLDLSLMRNYMNNANYGSSMFHIPVDSCGNFKACLPIVGPISTQMYFWTSYPDYIIPIMLCPGDHLTMTICDLGKATQHVTYSSEKGDFNNYLNNCPVFYSPSDIDYLGTKDSVDAAWTMDSVIRHVSRMDTLALYIAGKYGLSNAETQLLRTEANVNAVSSLIYSLSDVISAKYNKKMYGQRRQDHSQELFDSLWQISSHPCYRALSLLHADDNTFMVAGSYNFLFYSLFKSPIPGIIRTKQMADRQYCNDNDSMYERGILDCDSIYTDFFCSYMKRNPYADTLFRQSFLLNYFTVFDGDPSFKGPSPQDVYRKVAARKSRLITLPALQGLVKVAENNFINQ